MNPEDVDIPGFTGIGITVVLVGFVFRTLWLQGAAWKELLSAERMTSADARKVAAAAEVKAAAAEVKAAAAERAVQECERNHSITQDHLRRLQAQVDQLIRNEGRNEGDR
jgi:hypothetical protein